MGVLESGVLHQNPSLILADSVAQKPEVTSSSNPLASGGTEYTVCTVLLNPGLTLSRRKMLLSYGRFMAASVSVSNSRFWLSYR